MNKRATIRSATFDDIDQLINMRLRLQQHMSDRNPYLWQMSDKKVSELQAFYRHAIEDSQSLLLVVQGGISNKAIGTGLGRICRHDEYNPGASGRIDDVWVEPEHRRRGIGSKIAARLLDFFKMNQIEFLVLEYADGNFEAEALWRAWGFQSVLKMATGRISDLKFKMDKSSP